MPAEKVIVLGAGFQGVCVALGLRHRGYSVTLIDKARDCMLRASLRNEGKIHLGFVYAKDVSSRSSALMLRSSLTFASLVEEWLGTSIDWASLKSRPFTYVIARDSMLPPEALFASYERLQKQYVCSLDEPGTNYLGERPGELWREVSATSFAGVINQDFAAKFVQTVEVALHVDTLRQLMRSALHSWHEIEKLYEHTVESVVRTPTGFRVEGSGIDESWRREAGIVVNCLWDGRLKLDEEIGLAPGREWVYRLKYRLLGELPQQLAALPSLSVVLGPFGDVVVNQSNQTIFSWYPTCMRGWSTDVVPPHSWETACDGRADGRVTKGIARDTLQRLDEIIPGIGHSRIDDVDAGIIFSWGRSDIDDPNSELHKRHDVGPQSYDGYFSVDTGKLTCAPLFAGQLLAELS